MCVLRPAPALSQFSGKRFEAGHEDQELAASSDSKTTVHPDMHNTIGAYLDQAWLRRSTAHGVMLESIKQGQVAFGLTSFLPGCLFLAAVILAC